MYNSYQRNITAIIKPKILSDNIAGVVGDQGKVKIRELKVFQGEIIQILHGDIEIAREILGTKKKEMVVR